MPLKDKVVSLLRDAFSYAIHHESATDRARKAEVTEKIVNLSPLEDVAAKNRLHDTLLKVRTKFLDTLLEKNIAVTLDERLSQQKFARNIEWEPGKGIAHPNDVVAISAAFYPSENGGTVALYDNGKTLDQTVRHRNVSLLENLATLLKDGAKREQPIFGYTIIRAVGGEGAMAIVPATLWDTKMVESPQHLTGSKELDTPPAKKATPKPA